MTDVKAANTRKIPHAPFIADVEKHLGGPDVGIEATMTEFQEALSKYKFMEENLTRKRVGIDGKIPDIQKTLNMVEFLKERKETVSPPDDELADMDDEDPNPVETTFELNDTLYAKAQLDDSDSVYLWLGANVMLSYTLSEAFVLLSEKLVAAKETRENLTLDLEFLREQITIMEVNLARVYNWDVIRRRSKREIEGRQAEGT